jgi:hypothetical protein
VGDAHFRACLDHDFANEIDHNLLASAVRRDRVKLAEGRSTIPGDSDERDDPKHRAKDDLGPSPPRILPPRRAYRGMAPFIAVALPKLVAVLLAVLILLAVDRIRRR